MISGCVGQPNHLAIYLTLEYVLQHLFINPEEKENKQGTTGEPVPPTKKVTGAQLQPWRF